MKRFFSASAVFLSLSLCAFGQTPSIATGGIFQAATYSPSGMPNSAIAQGGFFTIFGTNLGAAGTPGPTAGQPIPTTLGATSVAVTVNGTTVQALMSVVTPGQINAILPSNTPTGTGTVSVTTSAGTSATQPVTVVANNFGTFTQNAAGTGPADVQDFTQNYALNNLLTTSKPGDIGILYGTGLGPNPGGDQNSTGTTGGLQTNLTLPNFHLYVGGVPAAVSYAGRSGYVGLDQIDFTIPSNAPTGCYVPVAVSVNGIVSNFATMSIDANGATCSDPYGLTPAQISAASTGTLNVASLLLTRLALNIGLPTLITEDDATANFYQFNGANYFTNPEHTTDFIGLSSFGSCSVTTCSDTVTCIPSAKSLSLPKLDAGAQLQVSGSGQSTVAVPKQTDGTYSVGLGSSPFALPGYPATPVAYLQPGTFTFSGSGGSAISAFSASINVPATPSFTTSPVANGTSPVHQGQDLTFNWTDNSSTDYFLVSVSSATVVGTLPAGQANSASITCLQKASAGTFTIPSWVLEALPASSPVTFGPLTNQPGGAVVGGIFNVSNTFTSNAQVSLANSIVLQAINTNVEP